MNITQDAQFAYPVELVFEGLYGAKYKYGRYRNGSNHEADYFGVERIRNAFQCHLVWRQNERCNYDSLENNEVI